MSIMKLLQQAQGGQGIAQLAAQLGLDEAKANQLAGLLAQVIGSAAKQRAESGGLESVLGALRGEEQAQMFEDASVAASPAGQQQGMAILESLMGDQQQAQGLASEAASRVGVDQSTVAQFLAALAAMAQGGLQKQMPDSSIDGMMQAFSGGGQGGGLMGMVSGLLGGGKAGAQGGPDLSMLTSMLDADGDGSILDDVMGKFIR